MAFLLLLCTFYLSPLAHLAIFNVYSNGRIFISVYANLKAPENSRTILMCIVTIPTILGFALVAWLPTDNKVGRLIGYCISFQLTYRLLDVIFLADLTGASNAVFVLALSLVSGNVGGTTSESSCSLPLSSYLLIVDSREVTV